MPDTAITTLTIKGYKSIGSLSDFELRNLNVLIGANGSGKSNFIDFFRLLRAMFQGTNGELQLFVARNGNASTLLHYGPKVTDTLEAGIGWSSVNSQDAYSFELGWGAPDNLYFTTEYLPYGNNDELLGVEGGVLASVERESSILQWAGGGDDDPSTRAAMILRDMIRSAVIYHFHDTSERSSIRLSQDVDREYLLKGDGGNLAAFLFNIKTIHRSHYRHILSTIRLAVPYLQDFVLEPPIGNGRYILLRWQDTSGEIFGPHQLSDGTIRFIALVSALLQPVETMPSIMLFDEPELGLHPSAIGLVASLLKSASEKRQIIVATQSPILIREYEPEDVIVVEREADERGHGSSTFTRLSTKKLGAWLKDYDLGQLYEKNVTGGGAQ